MAVSPAIREQVMQRDGNRCRACESTKRLTIDHILAKQAGGTDDAENLQVLCAACNAEKGGPDRGERVHCTWEGCGRTAYLPPLQDTWTCWQHRTMTARGAALNVYLHPQAFETLADLAARWSLSRSATIARALELAKDVRE